MQMQRVNQMLANKSPEQQEQTFRNACKSQGIDPDQFMKQYIPNSPKSR